MDIADSQYNFGRLYANGQGVLQDYVQAPHVVEPGGGKRI